MLERDQAAIVATLLKGPALLPGDIFAGDEAAVLRGLRVHANTISHARLVALEETFPRTRDYLGESQFNRLSRDFIESGGAGRRALADIGAGFAAFLSDPIAADLARAEWAWLDSYRAAEAPALRLADLAGLREAVLLDLPRRARYRWRAMWRRCSIRPSRRARRKSSSRAPMPRSGCSRSTLQMPPRSAAPKKMRRSVT